jgi:hypothetical protein
LHRSPDIKFTIKVMGFIELGTIDLYDRTIIYLVESYVPITSMGLLAVKLQLASRIRPPIVVDDPLPGFANRFANALVNTA